MATELGGGVRRLVPERRHFDMQLLEAVSSDVDEGALEEEM